MGKGITRARSGLILQNLFKVLSKYPDGVQAKVAIEEVASSMELTDHERGHYETTGARRFDKILRFCTIDAVKAGWIIKGRGIWQVTEAGLEALKSFPNPDDFYREASRLYWQWRHSTPKDEDEPSDSDNTEERTASITFEEAEEQAWEEISDYLEKIDPYDLQDLVASLLEAMGYFVAWVSPPGKDGGLDILAHTDPLGTRAPRIKVQVKRRKDNIGVEELRAFLALVNEDDVGIFVTTGGYTRDTEDLARSQERRKITLIDQRKLVELWIEYNDRVDATKRSALPLRPIYFLAPED